MTKTIFLKCLKLSVMMICAIVGVGFVSGAEIYQFYVRFGNFSYLGVIVFFVLIFFLTNRILKNNFSDKNISKMNNFDKNMSKNTILAKDKIKSILTFANILLVASAMFSGFFGLIKRLLNNNYLFFCFAVVLIVYFMLSFGIKFLEKLDFLVIFLLMFIGVIFFIDLASVDVVNVNINDTQNMIQKMFSAIFFACAYVFMNIAQIQPILREYNIKFEKKNRLCLSLIFSVMLTLFLVLFIEFLKTKNELCLMEMPFVNYFQSKRKALFIIFIFGLIFALMSSLLSALFGVKNTIQKFFKQKYLASAVAIILSVLISFLGFSTFVKVVYPVIGVINFVIFVFL